MSWIKRLKGVGKSTSERTGILPSWVSVTGQWISVARECAKYSPAIEVANPKYVVANLDFSKYDKRESRAAAEVGWLCFQVLEQQTKQIQDLELQLQTVKDQLQLLRLCSQNAEQEKEQLAAQFEQYIIKTVNRKRRRKKQKLVRNHVEVWALITSQDWEGVNEWSGSEEGMDDDICEVRPIVTHRQKREVREESGEQAEHTYSTSGGDVSAEQQLTEETRSLSASELTEIGQKFIQKGHNSFQGTAQPDQQNAVARTEGLGGKAAVAVPDGMQLGKSLIFEAQIFISLVPDNIVGMDILKVKNVVIWLGTFIVGVKSFTINAVMPIVYDNIEWTPIHISPPPNQVNLKQCHFPGGQKEITMATEMMVEVGVFRLVVSLFSALMWPVKETDSPWLLTIDYREVDKVESPLAVSVKEMVTVVEQVTDGFTSLVTNQGLAQSMTFMTIIWTGPIKVIPQLVLDCIIEAQHITGLFYYWIRYVLLTVCSIYFVTRKKTVFQLREKDTSALQTAMEEKQFLVLYTALQPHEGTIMDVPVTVGTDLAISG
ncbi:hypothetical protein XELAEV_18022179mg [Xenopus laevis]|uniref:Uncharacterized protein n=1 Tax=Xenopus laevis TaxID=8355 RepID=A0A974D4I3_XENLA|nr:hypothetical protein XELAEV_18022179mg [Xenopus laevis]